MDQGDAKKERKWGMQAAELQRKAMRRIVPAMAALVVMLAGCVSSQEETAKLQDMKFEVIEKEDIPPTLEKMLGEEKEKPFQITYADQGKLYIAQGYGMQPTTGYSVEVNELCETETAVCIKTTLIGPKKGEQKKEIATYPYVVVQTEYVEKEVLFD